VDNRLDIMRGENLIERAIVPHVGLMDHEIHA
jgi:hypothetical protein